MLRFESGAFKSQYACKMYSRQLNADMTSNGENFAICLDGVGGTIEFGVDSHHYARDFRDCLRTNIRCRVASADKRRYDAEVRSLLYPGVSAKQRRRLLSEGPACVSDKNSSSSITVFAAHRTKTRRVASLCSRHIVPGRRRR